MVRICVLCLALGMVFAGAEAGEACLIPDQIEGVVGGALRTAHSLVVKTRDGQKFLITTAGWCHDLDFKTANFSTCMKKGDWVPATGEAAKYTFGTIGASKGVRCIISDVRLYTPEMEAADRQTADGPAVGGK